MLKQASWMPWQPPDSYDGFHSCKTWPWPDCLRHTPLPGTVCRLQCSAFEISPVLTFQRSGIRLAGSGAIIISGGSLEGLSPLMHGCLVHPVLKLLCNAQSG